MSTCTTKSALPSPYTIRASMKKSDRASAELALTSHSSKSNWLEWAVFLRGRLGRTAWGTLTGSALTTVMSYTPQSPGFIFLSNQEAISKNIFCPLMLLYNHRKMRVNGIEESGCLLRLGESIDFFWLAGSPGVLQRSQKEKFFSGWLGQGNEIVARSEPIYEIQHWSLR